MQNDLATRLERDTIAPVSTTRRPSRKAQPSDWWPPRRADGMPRESDDGNLLVTPAEARRRFEEVTGIPIDRLLVIRFADDIGHGFAPARHRPAHAGSRAGTSKALDRADQHPVGYELARLLSAFLWGNREQLAALLASVQRDWTDTVSVTRRLIGDLRQLAAEPWTSAKTGAAGGGPLTPSGPLARVHRALGWSEDRWAQMRERATEIEAALAQMIALSGDPEHDQIDDGQDLKPSRPGRPPKLPVPFVKDVYSILTAAGATDHETLALFFAALQLLTKDEWVQDEGQWFVDLQRVTWRVEKAVQRKRWG